MDPDDRIAAADGIATAVKFQIKGARQDPALFSALVTLLTDQNEELRTMAANLLAPIRDAGSMPRRRMLCSIDATWRSSS